jgi:hypothetical protein
MYVDENCVQYRKIAIGLAKRYSVSDQYSAGCTPVRVAMVFDKVCPRPVLWIHITCDNITLREYTYFGRRLRFRDLCYYGHGHPPADIYGFRFDVCPATVIRDSTRSNVIEKKTTEQGRIMVKIHGELLLLARPFHAKRFHFSLNNS